LETDTMSKTRCYM